MNASRMAATVAACLSIMVLTACGGEDTKNTAESTPTPADSVAASASATASAPASPAAAAKSDKELCEATKKVSDEQKKRLFDIVKSDGDVTADLARKSFTEMSEKLADLADSGGDSKVTAGIKDFSAEAAKVAKAPHPIEVSDNPDIVKVAENLSAACDAVGVKVKLY